MGAWEWDLASDAMRWDEQMHHLFGLAPGAFGGRSEDFFNLLPEDERARWSAEMRQAAETREEFDGEVRVVPVESGLPRFLRIRCQVHGEPGQPACLIGVAWDISERRGTEQALARERDLLTSLMDHLPDNIYFKDRENRFIAANQATLERFGQPDLFSIIGKSDLDLFTPEHAQRAMEDERRIMETGQPLVDVIEKETWPDGHETWVSTTKLPLRDGRGQIIGTFGLSRDITARKLAEEQLARFTEELRAKNETLEQDLEMARELQNAMLPQTYPQFLPDAANGDESAVHFYHFYHPSMAVSGDFFDVLKISDDVAGLFICDVMGHGVRAALVAATVRALVGELRYTWNDPSEFLAQLNRALRGTLKNTGISLFASAFYVVADLARGELRYANAGHPHPLRVSHSANTAKPAALNGGKPGPALGIFDDAQYVNCRTKLSLHDVILVFTDGLLEVEGADGELYDYPQLLRAVRARSEWPTEALCRGLIEEVQQFSANQEFTDDVCLVAMEIDRLAAPR